MSTMTALKYAPSVLLLATAFAIVGLANVEVEDTPETRRADICSSEGEVDAGVRSKQLVERHLRSPSTADFPFVPPARYAGDCQFLVESYVDAQNGFGATIRSRYRLVMTYDPASERWSGRDLVID